MSRPTEPRERALEALYQADLRSVDDPAAGLSGKARRFVEGVMAHRETLDGYIDDASDHWAVHRMAAVDRAVLRLGAYELAFEPTTPRAVVISEAVEMAKKYSTQRSGAFINGVLAALAGIVRQEGPSS